MIFAIFISLLIWIFLGVLSCDLRTKKGYNGGFVFAVLFGVFALIYNAGLPDLNLYKKIEEVKSNFDKQILKSNAVYTGSSFVNTSDDFIKKPKEPIKNEEGVSHKWRCSKCGNMISSDPCPYCGKS